MSIPVNYLGVEPLLIARLAAKLTVAADGDVAQVGGVMQFDATLENDGPYPGAFVLYDGEVECESKGHDGRRIMERHRWQIGVLTKPEISADGAASLVATGTLMSKIIDAVAGWAPATDYQVMKRVRTEGRSVVYANGIALFVLDFEVGMPITMGSVT